MSETTWTRRALLQGALGAGALALLGRIGWAASAPGRKLRLGLLLPGPGASAADGEALAAGARLAAEEAGRTAMLLGASFDLVEATADNPTTAAREAARLVERERVFALVGGLDRATREALSDFAERSRVLFLTTRAPSEALYAEPVRQHQFHLAPSHYDLCRALVHHLVKEAHLTRWFLVGPRGEEGRYLAGTARRLLLGQPGTTLAGSADLDPAAVDFAPLLAQIAKARPDLVFLSLGSPTLPRLLSSLEREGTAGPAAPAVAGPFPPFVGDGTAAPTRRRAVWPALWHPALVQGGAVQLNQRFAARWHRPMGPVAWMGWAAVKAAAELALRAPAGADLAASLARFQFDGHKGLPLHFDFNHFLRQPIDLVGTRPGEPAGALALLGREAPEKGS
jgi:ABC-type branched-subunit amino acid transport system substrate-binding protein